jgi:ABC-type glycerol-3-phosphate transport system permease component
MAVRRTRPEIVLAFAIVALATVLTFYPVVWMVSASFKTNAEIFTTGSLQRGSAGWQNYASSFAQRPFFLYLMNSILAAGVSVIVSIVLGAWLAMLSPSSASASRPLYPSWSSPR